MKELPKAISKKLSDERSGSVRAEVSMPQLESVSLSGAAALKANGTFPDLQRRPFLLDMSGATHARGLSVSAYEAKIVLSGATEADLTGDFDEVSLDISGAGKLKLDTKCPELEAELSGSARADLKGEFKESFDRHPQRQGPGSVRRTVRCSELQGFGHTEDYRRGHGRIHMHLRSRSGYEGRHHPDRPRRLPQETLIPVTCPTGRRDGARDGGGRRGRRAAR